MHLIHGSTLVYIYILDARRGALKRPPSRAMFRRSDVPTLRSADAQTSRRSDVPTLRLEHRELKPKAAEPKPKAAELKAKAAELKTTLPS